jgi:hypothetical protein
MRRVGKGTRITEFAFSPVILKKSFLEKIANGRVAIFAPRSDRRYDGRRVSDIGCFPSWARRTPPMHL